MKYSQASGFTIVELLVVVAIIALLAAILVPVYSSMNRAQEKNTCLNHLREIGTALIQYREDFGSYPAAPAPEYLQSLGKNPDLMPFSTRPFAYDGTGTNDLTIGGSFTGDAPIEYKIEITDEGVDDPDPLNVVPGRFKVTEDGTELGVDIQITPGTLQAIGTFGIQIKFDNALGHKLGDTWTFWTDTDDVHIATYGLFTLYHLYLKDEKDYLRGYQTLHCPAQTWTENIDRSANNDRANFREFDPLMNGYNTYDLTYNYDQYDTAIETFDLAISGLSRDGNPSTNTKRQLKNPNPPADTVVTWCFTHTGSQLPSYDEVFKQNDGSVLAHLVPEDPQDLDKLKAQLRDAERTHADQIALVLWVDGTVEAMRPYLLRGKDIPTSDPDNPLKTFYWVPPFLYAPGEQE